MKIKATMTPYSSIVGGGVMLLGPKGNSIGQNAFLCNGDELRSKEAQEHLSRIIVDAINKEHANEE